jgi:intron-binding protein aquarius
VLTRSYSYLWPGYSDNASNYHVLLIVLITNVKKREQLGAWDVFTDRPDDFSEFFRRVLSMSLDHSLSVTVRSYILSFMICSFQSLDNTIVRKECAPLVSIGIWHNLSSETKRDRKLEASGHLRKAWRASTKRYDAADEETQARLRFERSWLYTLVLDFFNQLYLVDSKPGMKHSIHGLGRSKANPAQKMSCTAKSSSNFYPICSASCQRGDTSTHSCRTSMHCLQ